jgi:hypothetical protein
MCKVRHKAIVQKFKRRLNVTIPYKSLPCACPSAHRWAALNMHGNCFHVSFQKKELRMTIKLLISALAIAVSGVALAQTATPRVDQREVNQEKRIQQGAASGQLTPRETERLQKQQGRINNAQAKAKADGTVTPQERERLARMQNNASRDIAREKHDRQRVKH